MNIRKKIAFKKELKNIKMRKILYRVNTLKFSKEGEYKIKFKFNKLVIDLSYIFYELKKSIILTTNFNTKNINNIFYISYGTSILAFLIFLK